MLLLNNSVSYHLLYSLYRQFLLTLWYFNLALVILIQLFVLCTTITEELYSLDTISLLCRPERYALNS